MGQNQKNRQLGAMFETLIDRGCSYYRERGLADIIKTPEPMKVLKNQGNGRFEAVYVKKAQPDYKGVLKGGRAVVFEAKSTSTGRMYQSRVTAAQWAELELAYALGAEVFVLVDFYNQVFARVPWEFWREMDARIGRKYLTPGDVAGMAYPGLRFLD